MSSNENILFSYIWKVNRGFEIHIHTIQYVLSYIRFRRSAEDTPFKFYRHKGSHAVTGRRIGR